jgi:hypothetical protein
MVGWVGWLRVMAGKRGDAAGICDASTRRKVESQIMENAVHWLERGAALTWFTGFVLLGMVVMGGALMPLWVRANRPRGGSYRLTRRTGVP